MEKNLGHATAYGYAKSKGYSGTEEEFAELMADYASVGQSAAQSASEAAASATSASGSAAAASQAAQTATSKASEAVTAAGTATTKASEANQSASTASAAATSASTSAQTATAKAGTATAKADEAAASEAAALSAKTDAESARDAAAQSASEAAESARTLTIDTTLTQSGQAADAKATGDKIAQVKEDFTGISETVNGVVVFNYTEGKRIVADAEGYTIVDDTDVCTSELVPVTWVWDSTHYGRFVYTDDNADSTVYQIIFLDSNKDYLGFKGRNPTGQNVRDTYAFDNTAYAQFSFKKGFDGELRGPSKLHPIYWTASETLEQNGLVQNVGELDGLATRDKSSLVGAVNELKGEAIALPITPKDTDFFHVSKNMIDPSTCISGEYVNQTNGNFVTHSNHTRTDYIEVEPSTEYVVRRANGAVESNFRYVFYTAEKTYITGALGSLPDMFLTSPANAKYIVVSGTDNMALCMIAPYINGDNSFEVFGNDYILNEYIKPDMEDALLTIPSKIYALVGYELNIYFENITEEWEKYKWDVICSKGMQLERGYRITPVAGDVGTYTLTIRASLSDTISKEVTTTLVVTSASAGASTTKSVIVLGDSTTNNGIAITKLNENFSTDIMSISTLGTRGTAPNNHEGRSGWKLETYFTVESIDYTDGRGHVENPFYNPTTQTFDADYYFTNSGIAKPDWFIINMGINDMFSYETGTALESAINTCIGYVDSMIASVKSATPSSKIGVCLTIPPNHSQDAFGKAYKNGQTRYRYKKNNTIWVNRLISEYDNRESEDIYLIPIHTNLDTVYNMGMETLPVNARNTTVTYQSPISNGGVHPVDSGYWQIADVYTAFLKAHAED